MKDYGPIIRSVYAWVGFAVIWGLVLLGIARLLFPVAAAPAHAEDLPPVVQVAGIVTAYTSLPDETDSTPFVNAAGTRPHVGSLACPSQYALGTRVLIQGSTYECDDRMNAKYKGQERFDVWEPTKAQAVAWGSQVVIVTVLL